MIAAPSAGNGHETLPAFLAREARRATDGQLAFGALFGGLVVAAALLWLPDGCLYFFSSGLTCVAFSAWGILDRELAERGEVSTRASRVLHVGRVLCGAIGAVAAAGLFTLVLFIGLGTWIS